MPGPQDDVGATPRPTGTSMGDDGKSHYVFLEAEVQGLKENFADLKTSISIQFADLSKNILRFSESVDKRFSNITGQQDAASNTSRTNIWIILGIAASTIIGIGSLGATFWSLARAPIDNQLTDLKNDARDTKMAYVPRSEADARFTQQTKELDHISDVAARKEVMIETIKRLDEKIALLDTVRMRDADRLTNNIKTLDAAKVPRVENTIAQADFNERFTSLGAQISAMRDAVGAISSIADQVKQQAHELEELRGKFVVIPQFPKRPGADP